MQAYLHSSAFLSDCGIYRYALERVWDTQPSRLLIVGLNPSTADGQTDDPTVRRCVSFARKLGLAGLLIGNLFAARSPSPENLKVVADPIGPENDTWLHRLQKEATLVVAAWGNGGRLMNRGAEVVRVLRNPYCFGMTGLGEPRHPLYLRGDTAIVPFRGIY